MDIARPYLLFLGDAPDALAAKTADGIARWRPEQCVGQLRLPGCRADVGLPDVTVAEAAARGARTMVVGVANRGGRFGHDWIETMVQALEAGMDLAAGLHARLADVPAVAEAARALGRALHDVRHPRGALPVGTGAPRPGRRLLTVGTDCSVGKMFAALAIERALRERGISATFRATGQTGILVAGGGIAVDAVVADFIAGATEALAPGAPADHWDIIEGQGSLFHPSYAGVALGLLHGAQAEALVMCHEPSRPHMRGVPGFALPDIEDCIALNESCARLTCPGARVVGLAINTAALPAEEAMIYLDGLAARFGLPAVDPLRTGVGPIVDALA